MPTVNTELLITKLKEVIDLPAIQKEIDDLKAVSFSSPVALLKEASDIIVVILKKFQEILTELEVDLNDPAALESVKQSVKDFLDEVFDLPFWAEAFDDIAINWLVDFAFNLMVKKE